MFPVLTPLPAIPISGSASGTSYLDGGGYDVLIGGHGYRLATDKDFPYVRTSEKSTTQRIDNSNEPGEQTLTELPWPKSQSTFHAGAGQLNLEQGTSAFEYQQERVDHDRFDACVGVDVWTPGQVTRLPDCLFTAQSIATPTPGCAVAGVTSAGKDCMMIGAAGQLLSLVWNSGPDAAPTISSVDLSAIDFGGASNCTFVSVATDGTSYFASVKLTTAVSGQSAYIIKGALGTSTAPTVIYNCGTSSGQIAWQKARLMGALGNSIYELNTNASAHSSLPAVAYTYPGTGWTWTATAESPSGMLFAGNDGIRSLIIELSLTTTGGTPTLNGGTVVGRFPAGEIVYALEDLLASFLAVGTNKGIHICTYNTYTGTLQINPLSVTTTSPVYELTSRDRLIYGTYTSQQIDGSTGLVAVDVSFVVDAGGRNAWAPSLRVPTTAPTTNPTVSYAAVLPKSQRIAFATGDGIYVEGGSPGSDGDSYLRTSRIRFGTVEPKMFKKGLIRGSLNTAQIKIVGVLPYQVSQNLGTFGFVTSDPGEFQLTGLSEWLQLEFHLIGSSAVFNSYQVKAYPAPRTAELITFTLNCFSSEVDRFGNDVNDPDTPRQRYEALNDMKATGDEVTFVEFTNTTPVATKVVIDQLEFRSFSPPSIDDDFGGRITVQLRTTEN